MFNTKIKKNVLPFIFIAGLLLLLTPVLLSLFRGSDFLLSEESYYHIRIIDQYKETGVYDTDLLLNRPIEFNFFYFLLYFLNIPNIIIINMLPVIMGLICLSLFYYLIKEFGVHEDASIFSLIFLISAPIFIYTFTSVNVESFYLICLLFSFVLFLKKSYWVIPFSGFIAFLNIAYFIVFFIVILSFSYFNNKFNKKIIWGSLITSLIVLFVNLFLFKHNPFFGFFLNNFSVSSILISLGGTKAFSSITLALFFIGIFILWKRDFKFLLISLISILILISSFFIESLRIFVILEISVFSGICVKYFISKKWNVAWLKEVILLIIICSIIFASLVFMKYETNFMSSDYVDSFRFLKTMNDDEVVFSYFANGFMIQKIAGKKTFLDSYSSAYVTYFDKKNIENELFYTRDLKELKEILKRNKISHILIDERMLNGLVWNGPEDGVLFLLSNSNSFVKVFDNDAITIYRFVGN
ncbi:glycosyltransferase family 39 protein [Candidatus Woesearchaeota archaeon]|nr:glycosyltransferase family 39 protein [Candidatus Woesearchaeota archaeon]MCF7901420.1 glycosyltransferase family 39 protein [Candidatus Woesearchaeota archaeon]MCF8012967.1 glycosyltransferase family 39 protein [Candidatus Woesearchaeota archaeon]